jgi:excinuclease ABC subunit B
MTRRRTRQEEYNRVHGITPASIVKSIDDMLTSVYERDYVTVAEPAPERTFRNRAERDRHVAALEADMRAAADNLEFERAAALRDEVRALRKQDLGVGEPG